MTRKAVIPRARARDDIEEALEFYVRAASRQIALGFIDAVETAFTAIASNPAAGSPRYGFELDLPGLRHWPLRRYPHLVFYVERQEHIDVWRVLHAQRDLPLWMVIPDGS